jgi:hypothetical protein
VATHLFQLAPLVSFLVQHVLMYFFVIVGSTLLGLYEALQIFQVDTSGLPYNPIGLFCMFSCQHILLYFQGRFGALNNVFLAHHIQIVDRCKIPDIINMQNINKMLEMAE